MSLILTPFIPKIIDVFGKKNVFQWVWRPHDRRRVSIFFTPGGALVPALLFLAVKAWEAHSSTP